MGGERQGTGPETAAKPEAATSFIVATFNRHKAAELFDLLAFPGVTLVSLADWPGAESPEETGATLLENARIKARAAVSLTGLPAIADDTGLEVDALDGAPGVHAARYSGPGATYASNVAKLLRELHGVPAERRTARFRTVCVAAWPDGRELQAEGALEGTITEAPRGEHEIAPAAQPTSLLPAQLVHAQRVRRAGGAGGRAGDDDDEIAGLAAAEVQQRAVHLRDHLVRVLHARHHERLRPPQ